jgi:hypothetical protein
VKKGEKDMAAEVRDGATTMLWRRTRRTALAACAIAGLAAAIASGAHAALLPEEDPFYRYEGRQSLRHIPPGTVLETRTVKFHEAGIETPITAVQLLYRSTSQLHKPTVNVTSVLLPPVPSTPSRAISYQSFYDSLSSKDDPSYAISTGSGNLDSGSAQDADIEGAIVTPSLLAGEAVIVPDTEGEEAVFADGPVYGYNTLDALRAAVSSPDTGLSSETKIGLLGYSGGAIASEWAAELAPTYAPDVNRQIVGASFGGVFVDPDHNLHYVEGSEKWAAVIPMALIGVSRAFHIDLTPYMTEYGRKLYEDDQHVAIGEPDAAPGLTWSELAKPQYPTAESVPLFVRTVNKLIMGSQGTPTVPLLIGQGNGGETEGTSPSASFGPGDGVMLAGDVRSLAREYCERGLPVKYAEYEGLGHMAGVAAWVAETEAWLTERFAGLAAPENCAEIAPGNSLSPVKRQKR